MESSSLDTIIKIVIGAGAVGSALYLYNKFMNRDSSGERLATHEATQSQETARLLVVEREQAKVAAKIVEADKLSEDSKRKIEEIMTRAGDEVQEVLKERDLKRIQDNINGDWDKM